MNSTKNFHAVFQSTGTFHEMKETSIDALNGDTRFNDLMTLKDLSTLLSAFGYKKQSWTVDEVIMRCHYVMSSI